MLTGPPSFQGTSRKRLRTRPDLLTVTPDAAHRQGSCVGISADQGTEVEWPQPLLRSAHAWRPAQKGTAPRRRPPSAPGRTCPGSWPTTWPLAWSGPSPVEEFTTGPPSSPPEPPGSLPPLWRRRHHPGASRHAGLGGAALRPDDPLPDLWRGPTAHRCGRTAPGGVGRGDGPRRGHGHRRSAESWARIRAGEPDPYGWRFTERDRIQVDAEGVVPPEQRPRRRRR